MRHGVESVSNANSICIIENKNNAIKKYLQFKIAEYFMCICKYISSLSLSLMLLLALCQLHNNNFMCFVKHMKKGKKEEEDT